MSYEYQAYPKWVYYKTENGAIEGRVIQSPAELEGLPSGWSESPDGPFGGSTKKAPKAKRVSKPPRR